MTHESLDRSCTGRSRDRQSTMAQRGKPHETGRRRRHLLLTVLGASPRAARYCLGEHTVEAQMAPAALFELLPPTRRPDRLLALCTARAKKESWPLLEQVLRDRCELEVIDVPDGETQADVGEYLMRVADAVPNDVELTVDVTHGYRHFSFLTYVAVLYLSALRGVQVRGAYYGLLRSGGPSQPHKGAQPSAARPVAPDTLSPFLDLRPLLELPRWLHALETLRETGSTIPLADALRADPESQSARKVSGELSRLSEAYLSGLPLELGREAGRLLQSLKPLRKLLRDGHRLPLAGELSERIRDMIAPVALLQPSRNPWKRKVTLSADELKRQARVIDDLLQHGNVATALGLMNEWTVSWAVWRLDRNGDWLDHANVRRSAGNLLGAIAAVAGNPELRDLLTDDQRALGEFWRELCDLRNAYAHHGMRPQSVVGDPKVTGQLERIRGFWKKTLRACPNYPLSLGASPGGRVLVSPVGQRPGVLFSALRTCLTNGPTEGAVTCLAICSRETEKFIPEAVSRAGHTGCSAPALTRRTDRNSGCPASRACSATGGAPWRGRGAGATSGFSDSGRIGFSVAPPVARRGCSCVWLQRPNRRRLHHPRYSASLHQAAALSAMGHAIWATDSWRPSRATRREQTPASFIGRVSGRRSTSPSRCALADWTITSSDHSLTP